MSDRGAPGQDRPRAGPRRTWRCAGRHRIRWRRGRWRRRSRRRPRRQPRRGSSPCTSAYGVGIQSTGTPVPSAIVPSGQVQRRTMTPEIQSALPKYLQIANHIRQQIIRGELRPGAEVPSERQIADDWRVSRPTATRALAALRAEELVEARQGAGTFVREQPRLHRRARDRYERARSTGKVYVPGERAEITHAETAPAPEAVAVALGVPTGAKVVRRRRIVVDDG